MEICPRTASVNLHGFFLKFIDSMFKKTLTLLLLLSCSLASMAVSSKTYNFKVTAQATPSGQGKVYASETQQNPNANAYETSHTVTGSESSTGSAASKTFFVYAQPEEGYTFTHWTRGTKTLESYNRMAEVNVTSWETTSGKYASYTFIAHFAKTGEVYATTPDETLGTVQVTPTSNQIGDEVTLTANRNIFKGEFVAWEKASTGEIVSQSPTFTVTASNDTKGEYIARFAEFDMAKTGAFFRIRNNYSQRFVGLLGINQYVPFSSPRPINNALMLADGEEMLSSPAFVILAKGSPTDTENLDYAKLNAQGTSTSEVIDGDITIMKFKGYYTINTTAAGAPLYINDLRDTKTNLEHFGQVYHPSINNMGYEQYQSQYEWQFIPITRDDKEFAFGAKPSENCVNDGKYYTTMYADFAYELLDGVKAYIVTEADPTTGKVTMEQIEGNKVPKQTAVILECNSTSTQENRLFPITEEVPAIEGNLLKGEIWLKDKNASDESAYRKAFDGTRMMVLSNDGFKFTNKNNSDILADGTTGTLTYIANNTAYLEFPEGTFADGEEIEMEIEEEVESMTLKEALENEVTAKVAIVDGDLTGVAIVGNVLYAKDANGSALELDEIQDGETDYMYDNSSSPMSKKAYDQSNWVAITLPEEPSTDQLDLVGSKLNGVVGSLTNLVNPTFEAKTMPTAGDADPYTVNTYIAPNFNGSQSGELNGVTQDFFFVQPKAQEYATVQWVVYQGNGRFDAPDQHIDGREVQANPWGFTGTFLVDNSLCEGYDENNQWKEGMSYTFPAIITRYQPGESVANRAALIERWMVYPLRLTSGQDVVTGVTTVTGERTAVSVQYVSLSGHVSSQPQQGVNIVVTTWSDGSRTSTKVVR